MGKTYCKNCIYPIETTMEKGYGHSCTKGGCVDMNYWGSERYVTPCREKNKNHNCIDFKPKLFFRIFGK